MIKLITHTDLDGVGCEILGKIAFKDNVDVSRCNYNDINELVLKTILEHENYEKIIITDISVNEIVANRLNYISNKVKLLDHHPSALFLNDYSFATVEEICDKGKTCGTQLLYDYLGNSLKTDRLNYFVENVRRYDTWEWKDKYQDETPKRINDLLYIMGKDKFVDLVINKIKNNEDLFDDTVNMILELRQNEINEYIKNKDKLLITHNILGYKAGVVFADNFISELGNKLSEMHPELDFIAMINQETISYRTVKEDINLTEIAKHFGGGGHPKASGSQINKEHINKFISTLLT